MQAAIEDILRDALDAIEEKIKDVERSLVPLFAEREKIRRALEAVSEPVQQHAASSALPPPNGGAGNPFSSLTMKELTVKALEERFVNGATAAQLIEFFAEAWGRKDIVRSSFSPQLSRLKNEGIIELHGKNWRLVGPKENEPPLGGSETGEVAASPKLLNGTSLGTQTVIFPDQAGQTRRW